MAGHNKWSKVKRKKGVNDAKRSKIWARIIRDIMMAARDGGGDPNSNAKLALHIDKAKAANMPKDNMERAIKRGTGEIEGADYVETSYEGYGPAGIAVFVDVLTDNTNRSVADIRHIFAKCGGNMGTNGSVAFMFERKGIIEISAEGQDELELFELVVEAGAEDLQNDDGVFTVTTPLEAFGDVNAALAGAGIEPSSENLERIPTTTTKVTPDEGRKVAKLIEMLEENDDVQSVATSMEFDDAVMEALS